MDASGTKPAFWRSFGMFEGLDAPALAAIAAITQRRVWAPGEVLFQRGDEGDWMVALAEGRVKLTLLTPQGRELILRHAEPGDTLGELSLIDGEPRSADATAVVPVVGWVLERKAYVRLCADHPELALTVARYVSRRLRETTEQLEGIALYQLEARLARFFLFSLRQFNGDDLPDQAVLRLEISQGELAAVLGASRPKVNRALQVLQENGALERQAEAWVIHVAPMRRAADPEP
jgi:CRP/FNR family transcriptional regulator, cyclic AMP receptor protein